MSNKKLTQAQLKQIIKEELKAISEIYDPEVNYGHGNAFNDEWGSFSQNDNLKYGKSPWFSSHFRDQMLQRVEDRLPIPPDHIWRKIERALTKAGLYKPSPEADAFIEDMLDSMREEASARPSVGTVNPYTPKEIPEYWTLQEGKRVHLRKEGMFDWFGGGKEEAEEAPAPEPEQEQEQDFEMPSLTSIGQETVRMFEKSWNLSPAAAYAAYQGWLYGIRYSGGEGWEWIGTRTKEKYGWDVREGDFVRGYDRELKRGGPERDAFKKGSALIEEEELAQRGSDLYAKGYDMPGWGKGPGSAGDPGGPGPVHRTMQEQQRKNEEWSSYEGDQKLFENWRKFTGTKK